MALQSSGAISLLDIANEFGGSTPHSINEYYGAAAGIPSSGTIDFADFYGKSAGTPVNVSFYEHRYGANIGTIRVYVTNSSGGLVSSMLYTASGDTGTSWFQRNTASFTATESFRVVWWYETTQSGYRGDYSIDAITINGNFYSFENNSQGFVTTEGINTRNWFTAYADAENNPVPSSTSSVLGRWNRNSRTTSGGTGPSSAYSGNFFIYAETTSPNNSGNVNFWLFSPLFNV